jgi:hypothetical protein
MAKKFDFLSPGIEIREIDQSFIPALVEAEGPIIIGRTKKGPANKPVKVRNLDDFVSIFGLPVAGGNGLQGDVWREGNTVGPTYASYAAQAWLASEESPVVMVRMAGEQHSDVVAGSGEAGWQVGSEGIGSDGNNSTAYGLFLCDSSDAGIYGSQTITATSGSGMDNTTFEITGAGGSGVAFTLTSSAGTPSDTQRYVVLDSEITDSNSLAAAVVEEIKSAIGAISELEDISVSYVENLNTFTILNKNTVASADTDQGTASSLAGFGSINAATAAAASAGSLAAVFYCVTGALSLSGNLANTSTPTASAGALIENVGNNKEFKIQVHDSGGEVVETVNFNFTRTSDKYIRNQFNTNPQLTNSVTTDSSDLKTYWLGESFLNHVESNVTSSNEGDVYGILLPLSYKLDSASSNWGYHKYSAREAKSGWVFSQKSTNQKKLFRFKSLHVGEEIQKNYLISIEQITAPSNPNVNNYGTFTVCIKDLKGNTVEKFSGLDLNPSSPNYIAARIGDQYQTWSDTDKRYRTYGDFQNQSNYFYIEMNEAVSNGGGQGYLPAGFYGPVRPKGFGILSGEDSFRDFDNENTDFANAVVRDASSSNLFKGQTGEANAIADLEGVNHVKFQFPKMRMRDNGSDGGASNQARVYWGVRPKLTANSNQHDTDFIDYTRGLGMNLGVEDSHTPGTDFEYSFTFSLDDVSGSATTGIWSWTEGNYDDDLSYSKANGFNDLLAKDVRQFIMPVWGGSEGFDITEMEPLRNGLISNGTLDTRRSYVDYTISKAIDSVSDPEVVPANLIMMPGINKASATDKLINVAESRKDVLAIIDLERDYVPRVESKDDAITRLGSVVDAVSTLRARSINSSYACSFYPWVQISDNLNGSKLVWVPPSVAALGAFGRSQSQTDLWFAPAGFNRGGLGNLGGQRGPRVIQARQRLDSRERDLLYEVNINPIATFPAEGVVIFGQKTLQADQSALDRINVRRLVLYLKSRVSQISRNLLFDQNLSTTWTRFESQVKPLLSQTQSRFGISDYKLILDETTTTSDLIDRNIMYAKIYIKPARAIEYIVVDFVITKTGADFV